MNLKSGYLAFLFLLIFSNYSWGQSTTKTDSIFSGDLTVSLLTFDKGDETYSVWGHTAIRVKDKQKNVDLVYNYGVFDFDAPYFLIKFLRGKLNYSLGINDYSDVYRYYRHYKRGIYEQILNLSYDEKLKLYNLLQENYKKENRYYKYDFFFDNCSTRPLQIIEKSLDGNLVVSKSKTKKTFRQLLNRQIANHPWMDFGIDLIIGARADKYPTVRQSTFLPPQLQRFFSKAKVNTKPSIDDMKTNRTVIKKLVKKEYSIFSFDNSGFVLPKILHPIWIFTFFFMLEIIIFVISYKKRKILFKWYDKLWFVTAFVAGLLITFLWFFTDHKATKDNWNFIWLNPLFLFVFLKQSRYKTILIYIVTALMFITLLGFSIFPQEMHPAIIPIIGLLILKLSKYGILKSFFTQSKPGEAEYA